jgi:hypothetical protein
VPKIIKQINEAKSIGSIDGIASDAVCANTIDLNGLGVLQLSH